MARIWNVSGITKIDQILFDLKALGRLLKQNGHISGVFNSQLLLPQTVRVQQSNWRAQHDSEEVLINALNQRECLHRLFRNLCLSPQLFFSSNALFCAAAASSITIQLCCSLTEKYKINCLCKQCAIKKHSMLSQCNFVCKNSYFSDISIHQGNLLHSHLQ